MRTVRQLAALLITGAVVAFAGGSDASGCARDPSRAVLEESVRQGAGVLESLLRVGKASGVCLGIELVDRSLADGTVNRDIPRGRSVPSVIRALLADSPGYCVETRGRILSVAPCTRPAKTWLDFVLPRINVHAEQVQVMSATLSMWLSSATAPAKGYGGHRALGDPADTVGPYDKTNVTVRELLDLFVADSHGALWITTSSYARGTAPREFWRIIEYGSGAGIDFPNSDLK